MISKSIKNDLKLVFSPISTYDFENFKGRQDMQDIFNESHLYIIAQRAELTFNNIHIDENSSSILFEIQQKDNSEILKCNLPIIQENIAQENTCIYLEFGFIDEHLMKTFNNIWWINIYEKQDGKNNFLISFTPEKFILNAHNKIIEASIDGNYRELLKYKVHYVGKATEQNILKRLTGHSTLQSILSIETPFVYGSLPTHEITLLLFTFFDTLEIRTGVTVDEIINQDKDIPKQKNIYLDAEKAIIKAFNPKKYNKTLYTKYPKSDDGLYKHNYNTVVYTLQDPITLLYEKGEFVGGIDNWGGDIIRISNNKEVEIIERKANE